MKKKSVKGAMKKWTIISSIVIALLLIWDIIQLILFLTGLTPNLIHQYLLPTILDFVTNNLLRVILIYTPLFYLVFNENSKNTFFKIWAKISTILFSIMFISDYMRPYLYGRLTLIMDLVQLTALVPLYYFAWNLSKLHKLNK